MEPGWGRGPKGSEVGAGQEGPRFTPAPEAVVLTPQGCYEKVKQWFADNKHVLGTVGMCLLITQVRGPSCQRGGGDSPRETPPRRACAPHPGPARASSHPPEPWTCAGLAGRAGWDRPVPPRHGDLYYLVSQPHGISVSKAQGRPPRGPSRPSTCVSASRCPRLRSCAFVSTSV